MVFFRESKNQVLEIYPIRTQPSFQEIKDTDFYKENYDRLSIYRVKNFFNGLRM